MKIHDAKIERGYPHLNTVKRSIKAFYKSYPSHEIRQFSVSLSPSDLSIKAIDDTVISVQRLASKIAKHLNLPVGIILVSFHRKLTHPAQVELTQEDSYLISLHEEYRMNNQDVAALLAHEIVHIFLYQRKMKFIAVQDNELLTDTLAAYLGVG